VYLACVPLDLEDSRLLPSVVQCKGGVISIGGNANAKFVFVAILDADCRTCKSFFATRRLGAAAFITGGTLLLDDTTISNSKSTTVRTFVPCARCAKRLAPAVQFSRCGRGWVRA
jgi:hypothetical protein